MTRALTLAPEEDLFLRRRAEIYSDMRNYAMALVDYDVYLSRKPDGMLPDN